MKHILFLFNFLLFSTISFSQIEKPKPNNGTKPKPIAVAATQATIEITWNGTGTAIIHIGEKTIALANKEKGELAVVPATAFAIKVERPDKTYSYSDFVKFNAGKNLLTVDLVNGVVSVILENEEQKQNRLEAEKLAREKFKSDSTQKVVEDEKARIAAKIAKAKQEIADSVALVEAEKKKREYENSIVKIGEQTWMKKNLDVDHYRNGDAIPQVQDPTEWKNLTTGAWCYYDNDPANAEKYGKLYNWYAVNDPRGLAPLGWHVPDNSEWGILINYFGGEGVARFSAAPKYAGRRMKSATGWLNEADNGTDEGGFSALPSGYRKKNGEFGFIGKYTGFWSSTFVSQPSSVLLNSIGFKDEVFLLAGIPEMGNPVRCIRDANTSDVTPQSPNNGSKPAEAPARRK